MEQINIFPRKQTNTCCHNHWKYGRRERYMKPFASNQSTYFPKLLDNVMAQSLEREKNKNLRKPMKPVLGRLTRKRRFTLQESLCSGASAPSTPALQFIPFYLLSAPLPRGGYCLPCLLQIALLCLIYLSVDILIKIQMQIN